MRAMKDENANPDIEKGYAILGTVFILITVIASFLAHG